MSRAYLSTRVELTHHITSFTHTSDASSVLSIHLNTSEPFAYYKWWTNNFLERQAQHSLHKYGQGPKRAVAEAVARLLKIQPNIHNAL